MRLRTVVIGLGVLALAGLGLFALVIGIAVSSLPSGEHPDISFQDPEIVEARRAIVPQLEARLDAVERRFGAKHVGPRGRVDNCEPGFDDFTRQDAYAYVCRMEIVQVMPVRKPFRANASRLGEALLEGDCPSGTDTDRALAQPFDDIQELDETSGGCTGYHDPGPVISGWVRADPTADELERARHVLPLSCYPWHEAELCEETPLVLRVAIAAAPPGTAYLAIVTTGFFDDYYRAEWE